MSIVLNEKLILVVDDDESIRAILSDALALDGYVVLQASSGRSALKILERQPVSLILSDIEMKDGDGFFLLKEIQLLAKTPPLVFISAHTEITLASVKDLGAADFIRKPFDANRVFNVVSALIANSV